MGRGNQKGCHTGEVSAAEEGWGWECDRLPQRWVCSTGDKNLVGMAGVGGSQTAGNDTGVAIFVPIEFIFVNSSRPFLPSCCRKS